MNLAFSEPKSGKSIKPNIPNTAATLLNPSIIKVWSPYILFNGHWITLQHADVLEAQHTSYLSSQAVQEQE